MVYDTGEKLIIGTMVVVFGVLVVVLVMLFDTMSEKIDLKEYCLERGYEQSKMVVDEKYCIKNVEGSSVVDRVLLRD